jgi:hypothetical protein
MSGLLLLVAVLFQAYPWLQTGGDAESMANRIRVPAGHERVAAAPGTFAAWLRHLPLKPGASPVRLHDGTAKLNQEAHAAVVEIDIGTRDLQQCADAVIRLRAEYLYSTGRLEAIRFHFTNGEQADFERWAQGFRPRVERNRVSWSQSAPGDTSHSSLRQFLDVVFEYAGTFSLSRELASVRDVDEMKIGDVFIQGGFPGHAAVVVDMAVRRDTGKKVFLLAQSFMPAQDVHILKNPNDPALSPWYALDFEGEFRTPEWTFRRADLRRWR